MLGNTCSDLWPRSQRSYKRTYSKIDIFLVTYVALSILIMSLDFPEYESEGVRFDIKGHWELLPAIGKSNPSILSCGKNRINIYWNKKGSIFKSEVILTDSGPSPCPATEDVLSDISAIRPFSKIFNGFIIYGAETVSKYGTETVYPTNRIFLIEDIEDDTSIHWITDRQAEEVLCPALVVTGNESFWLIWTARKENSSKFEIALKEIKASVSDLGEVIEISEREEVRVTTLDEECSFRFIQVFSQNNGDKAKVFFTVEKNNDKKVYCGELNFRTKEIASTQLILDEFPGYGFSVASPKHNEWIFSYSKSERTSSGKWIREILIKSCRDDNWKDEPINLFEESDYDSKGYIDTDPSLDIDDRTNELWITWKSSPLGVPDKYVIKYAKISFSEDLLRRIFYVFLLPNLKNLLIGGLVVILVLAALFHAGIIHLQQEEYPDLLPRPRRHSDISMGKLLVGLVVFAIAIVLVNWGDPEAGILVKTIKTTGLTAAILTIMKFIISYKI